MGAAHYSIVADCSSSKKEPFIIRKMYSCMQAFVTDNLCPFNKRMSELHNVPSRWISGGLLCCSASAPQVKRRGSSCI